MKHIKTILLLMMVSVIGFSQEKVVTEIHFEGIKKTKASFLSRLIKMQEGAVIDSVTIRSDVKTLIRLPAIADASYTIAPVFDNKYKLTYVVKENRTIIPNVNIWTAVDEQFAYKVGLYDFNFLGNGMTFGGFYQNNGYDSYGIGFSAPYLFTRKFGLGMFYKKWQSNEPLYFKNAVTNYTYANKSIEVNGLYEANFKNKFTLGVNFFNEDYQYKSGDLPEGIPNALNLDKVLLKAIHEYNDLKYNYQYIEGFKNVITAQFVKSTNAKQEDFIIAWNDLIYQKKITSKGLWANRFRTGLSNNSDSPFAPFSLDNNVNIRGVGILVDRGTGVLLLNTEYRHTLYEKKWFVLQGNAFVDVGSWRKPGGELSDFFKTDNTSMYPGLGLRFMHKYIYNAVFRIDYGYGIGENASRGLVFGIGQYF